jgi:uncharacterized protein
MTPYRFLLHQQTLWLSPDRTLFWEEAGMLVISDAHLGKSGHFRKSGIAVPNRVFKEDMQRLIAQIQFFKPRILLFTGDLFHSHDNGEHQLFLKWRNDFPQLDISLVRGNHDILEQPWYDQCGIQLIEKQYVCNGFCFVHDIKDYQTDTSVQYAFSGHIHPGILLSGSARQSLRLPCFYFGRDYAVLPAFGRFTGTFLIEPRAKEQVFAILPANARRQEKAMLLPLNEQA